MIRLPLEVQASVWSGYR